MAPGFGDGLRRDRWETSELVSFCLHCSLTLMMMKGYAGGLVVFDGGPDAYRLTSFGDDVGESFTVLWVTLLR